MRIKVLLFMSVLTLSAVGCSQPYVSEYRLDQGLAVVFTGIEGRSGLNEDICHGLNAGGVDWAIELNDWTIGLPGSGLINLRNEMRNRQKAAEIARRVGKYIVDYPGRPVVLIGQSGGAAIAVWVAESLPPGRKVDGVVLLAATLSPEYSLDEALLNSRRGIVSFHSARDWVFLGAGTSLAGTMDGAYGAAAGQRGFTVPTDGPRAGLYGLKLFQVAWSDQVHPSGFGGHLTSGSREFVARHVAPLCRASSWNQRTIDRVVSGQAFLRP